MRSWGNRTREEVEEGERRRGVTKVEGEREREVAKKVKEEGEGIRKITMGIGGSRGRGEKYVEKCGKRMEVNTWKIEGEGDEEGEGWEKEGEGLEREREIRESE